MKKLILSITTAIILFSCDLAEPNFEYSIAPEIQPFVEIFYAEAESHGHFIAKRNMKMYLVTDLEKKHEARAQSRVNILGQRSIVIDRDYFEFSIDSEPGKLMITRTIFHEYGHAIYNKRHNNNPMSVMSSTQEAIDNWIRYPDKRKEIIDLYFK